MIANLSITCSDVFLFYIRSPHIGYTSRHLLCDLKGTPLVALELKQSGEKEAGFLTSDARRVLSSRQQRSAVTPRFD